MTPKQRLLSYVPVSHSPRSLLSSEPVLPAIYSNPRVISTKPSVTPWNLSWVVRCLIGHGLRQASPAVMVALIFAVPHYMLQLLFLASSTASKHLVERILGHPPSSTLHTVSVMKALATTAARSDWQNIDDIDVPLRQRSLSHSIDEASFQNLLSSAPTIRSSSGILFKSASCRGLA